ncbi:uncharacterized protein LOC134543227 [Bacillus rossius redtenbacheri]|uniref:uncharacterized protein LOC134543227 n=1 Tax=Bacillus rossius redtenbacheri TaxID=93214 RepID=UPI002FDEEB81
MAVFRAPLQGRHLEGRNREPVVAHESGVEVSELEPRDRGDSEDSAVVIPASTRGEPRRRRCQTSSRCVGQRGCGSVGLPWTSSLHPAPSPSSLPQLPPPAPSPRSLPQVPPPGPRQPPRASALVGSPGESQVIQVSPSREAPDVRTSRRWLPDIWARFAPATLHVTAAAGAALDCAPLPPEAT